MCGGRETNFDSSDSIADMSLISEKITSEDIDALSYSVFVQYSAMMMTQALGTAYNLYTLDDANTILMLKTAQRYKRARTAGTRAPLTLY